MRMQYSVLAVMALGLCACHPATATADLTAAKNATGSFHNELNAFKFDDKNKVSSDEMQDLTDVTEFEQFLNAVHS